MAEYYEPDQFAMDRLESENLGTNIKLPVSLEKGYYKVTRPFNGKWKDGKYYKNITVEMYGSGDSGTYIRNAVTGEYTKHIVGSKAEELFYKVAICTGIGRNGPICLFYDTRSQYETHQMVV